MSRPSGTMSRVLAVALPLALAFASPARAAEEGAGTRAAGFLVSGAPPSVLAMGGATLALGRDVSSASWNPAALGWLGVPQLALAHASFDDQTAQEWIAGGTRLGRSRTRIALAALVHDDGTITGMDASNRPTSDVRAQDLALTLQLARPLGARAAVGGAAHLVRQSVGDVAGTGYAFDAGAQARFGTVSLALAGRNFGGGMRWAGAQWRMPASLGAGVAFEPNRSPVRLALDWEAPADYYRNVRVGAEWRWHDRLALRGGWRQELSAPSGDRLGGPAFGFGAGSGPWWIDYGYVIVPDGAGTHRVGLSLRGHGPADREHPARPSTHAPVPAPRPYGPDPASGSGGH